MQKLYTRVALRRVVRPDVINRTARRACTPLTHLYPLHIQRYVVMGVPFPSFLLPAGAPPRPAPHRNINPIDANAMRHERSRPSPRRGLNTTCCYSSASSAAAGSVPAVGGARRNRSKSKSHLLFSSPCWRRRRRRDGRRRGDTRAGEPAAGRIGVVGRRQHPRLLLAVVARGRQRRRRRRRRRGGPLVGGAREAAHLRPRADGRARHARGRTPPGERAEAPPAGATRAAAAPRLGRRRPPAVPIQVQGPRRPVRRRESASLRQSFVAGLRLAVVIFFRCSKCPACLSATMHVPYRIGIQSNPISQKQILLY